MKISCYYCSKTEVLATPAISEFGDPMCIALQPYCGVRRPGFEFILCHLLGTGRRQGTYPHYVSVSLLGCSNVITLAKH